MARGTSVTLAIATTPALTLPDPDDGIQTRVQQVDDEIDRDDDQREHEDRRLYDGEVELTDRRHDEPAGTRNREHGLGDDRAPEHESELQTGDGDDRPRGIRRGWRQPPARRASSRCRDRSAWSSNGNSITSSMLERTIRIWTGARNVPIVTTGRTTADQLAHPETGTIRHVAPKSSMSMIPVQNTGVACPKNTSVVMA